MKRVSILNYLNTSQNIDGSWSDVNSSAETVPSYEQDPTYWGAKAVVLVPDTLMAMGKYDEALTLCKEILKNHPSKIDIRRAISEKQDEIIRERDMKRRSI